FTAIPGQGFRAKVYGKNVLVGTRKLMRDNDVEVAYVEQDLSSLEKDGNKAMLIDVDGKYGGSVATADTSKETSAEAIGKLKNQGLEVIILTGDNEQTAKAIAKQVRIDRVIAQVLPEDKADKVKEIQLQRKSVAMVGDGVNDAPALAVADIGIAIGTGTEVAIEAADITILGGELLLIPKAIQLSK